MKKILLGSTALLGVGLAANTAAASDGIKLTIGGWYTTAYQAVFDDDGEGEPGDDRNTDNFSTDGEIHFTGKTTLDNGLTVGVHVELEAEQSDDQIDESYAFWEGGFGEVRIGNDDSAMQGACITPPGYTNNFGATSPSRLPYNDGFSTSGVVVAPTSQTVCAGVDNDATKIVYYSPIWSGFSFALSYTPDGDTDGGVTHGFTKGGTGHADSTSRHNFSGYASYSYEGDDWGLTFGAGAEFEGAVDDDGTGDSDRNLADHYQTGLILNFGRLSLGGSFMYMNDMPNANDIDADGWVAAGGISYNVDAWTVGFQYSHLDFDNNDPDADDDAFSATRDRVSLQAMYAIGPGVEIDAGIGYTWIDIEGAADGSGAETQDGYDAFDIGVGTSFTF